MRVVTMLNQKGGVGKTTLAVCLGSRWHLSGYRVAIIDADPQHSLLHWSGSRSSDSRLNGVDVFEAESANDLKQIPDLDGYDFVIIDTPGTDKVVSRTSLEVCDQAIIPVTPSAFDVRASMPTLELARSMGRSVGYLVTKLISRSDLGDEVMQALSRTKAGLVRTAMGQYTAYVRSLGHGEVPQTMFPGTPAARNMEAVGQAVESAFGWRE